jgi:hypothetical protein
VEVVHDVLLDLTAEGVRRFECWRVVDWSRSTVGWRWRRRVVRRSWRVVLRHGLWLWLRWHRLLLVEVINDVLFYRAADGG